MASSRVWLRQAKSDLLTAQYLAEQDTESFCCQTAAKCQQVVEKSVKAIAAELTERGLVTLTIGFDHRVDQYIAAIVRTPRRSSERKSVPAHIQQTLQRNRNEISTLMSLAPHKPANANALPRNTEYPFHNTEGLLIAPSDPGIFQKTEIISHLKVAHSIFTQAQALISIVERTPR